MAAALLPDPLWDLVEPLLPIPPRLPQGGRPRVSDRACLTGIVFVLRSGIRWQMLPQELGCGSGMTCWRRLRLATGGCVGPGPIKKAAPCSHDSSSRWYLAYAICEPPWWPAFSGAFSRGCSLPRLCRRSPREGRTRVPDRRYAPIIALGTYGAEHATRWLYFVVALALTFVRAAVQHLGEPIRVLNQLVLKGSPLPSLAAAERNGRGEVRHHAAEQAVKFIAKKASATT